MVNKYTTAIGDGEATEFTIKHGLATTDVVIDVYHALLGSSESFVANRIDENTVTIIIDRVIKHNVFKVVIIG